MRKTRSELQKIFPPFSSLNRDAGSCSEDENVSTRRRGGSANWAWSRVEELLDGNPDMTGEGFGKRKDSE